MTARALPGEQGSGKPGVGGAGGDAAPPPAPLVQRLRDVHLKMVDAVLAGDGLVRVAELAAAAADGPVAIVVPRIGVAVLAPEGGEAAGQLPALKRYVADRLRDRPAEVPAAVAAEVPIAAGDEALGAVVLLASGRAAPPEAGEFLHLTAVASLTEVAVEEAREEVEQNLRGSFLEELRARTELEPEELVRRAARLGTDLSHGAIVLCAELTSDRPRHVVATIAGEHPGALAQHMDGRVYALLPAVGAGEQAASAVTHRIEPRRSLFISTLSAIPAAGG